MPVTVGQHFPTSMEHLECDEHWSLGDCDGGDGGGGDFAGAATAHTAQFVFVVPPAEAPGAQQRQPQARLCRSDHMM